MPPAARVTDMHTCPLTDPKPHVGGQVQPPGSTDVFIEDAPAARAAPDYTGEFAKCEAPTPDFLAQGSPNVFLNDKLATRRGDLTQHGGRIDTGALQVEIGIEGDAATVLPIRGGRGRAQEDASSSGSDDGTGAAAEERSSNHGDEQPAEAVATGSVHAAFERVRPSYPTVSKPIVLQCISWDPDTGGSQAHPNPNRIVRREWTATIDGQPVAWSTTARTDTAFTFAIHDWPDESNSNPECTVTLQVEDEQGHTDETSATFVLRRPREELVAVIHMRQEGNSTSEIARTGTPGREALPATARVVFEDQSFIIDEYGEIKPERRAFKRSWDIRPAATLAESGGADKYEYHTFRRPGSYTVKLKAYTSDRRDLHASAQARIDVGAGKLDAEITHHTHAPAARVDEIWAGAQDGYIVIGDTVTFHGSHSPAEVAAEYEWEVEWAGKTYVSRTIAGTEIGVPLISGFTGAESAHVVARLTVYAADRKARSRTVAYPVTVVPLLTWSNVYDVFKRDIAAAGLSYAISGTAGLLTGGLATLPLASVSAIASQVIVRGLVDLGASETMATVVSSLVDIGAGGAFAWRVSKDAWMKPFAKLTQEGKIGTHAYKRIKDIWQAEKAKSAFDPAARAALQASFVEFTEYLVQQRVIPPQEEASH